MKLPSPLWLALYATLGLILLIVGTAGGYLYSEAQQKKLQDELRRTGGAYVFPADRDREHWLVQYVPGWKSVLPEPALHVSFGQKSLEEGAPIARNLKYVTVVGFTKCDPQLAWEIVESQRYLDALCVTEMPVDDSHIERLAGRANLRMLILNDVPLTDGALDSIAQLSALRHLTLRHTNISHAAITTFAAAHPDLAITWTPHPTAEHRAIQQELAARNINVGVNESRRGICSENEWELFQRAPLTSADVELLRQLGPLVVIWLEAAAPHDVLKELSQLPHPRTIVFDHEEFTADDVKLFAQLPTVEIVQFKFDRLSESERQELEDAGASRLVDNP